MIGVDILLIAALALAAVGYGIARIPWSDGRRALLAALPQRGASGGVTDAGGLHRIEDAHTGSLSATAILRAMNAEAGLR